MEINEFNILDNSEYESFCQTCGSCLYFVPFKAEAGFCKIAKCNCICKNPKAMIDMWDNKCDKWVEDKT